MQCFCQNDFTEASELLGNEDKSSELITAENELMVNGDVTPTSDKPANIVDSKTDNGPRPTAERCRLSETGDQLQDVVESPFAATSPVLENGGDCCASVNGNEGFSGNGILFIIKSYTEYKKAQSKKIQTCQHFQF